MSEQMTSMELC